MPRDRLLGVVREALRSRAPLELAIVFGSVARGAGTPTSDLDLAVLGEAEPLGLAADLSSSIGREVDVVAIETASIPLLSAIVRDGIIVFEGEPGAGARFLAGAWATLAVDLPWYERMQRTWLERVAKRGVLGRP